MDLAANAHLTTDAQGVIREANFAASRLLGRSRDFLIGKPLAFFVADPFRSAFYKCLLQLSRNPATFSGWELRLHCPGAVPVDVYVEVRLGAHEEDSRTYHWIFHDISARKEAERALDLERDFSDQLVDTAPVIILVLDEAGKVARANPHTSSVTGYPLAAILERHWHGLMAEESQPAARNWLDEARRTRETQGLTCAVVTRDGAQREVTWSITPLARGHEADAACKALIVGHDISHLRETQQRLIESERLAAIGQVMTNLAHESRNALQRAQACLERLAWRLHDQPEPYDLVQRTLAAQRDLARLFDEVRSYAAPMVLEKEPCSLIEIWREAWRQVEAVNPQRTAALREDRSGADLQCSADTFRLIQVFRNLFENAFAAAPDKVEVDIACKTVTLEGTPALCIAVRDNGCGFPANKTERVFEPFYTTKPKGSGLGLSICRRILEAHRGGITAKNSAHGGAEIVITLPRR